MDPRAARQQQILAERQQYNATGGASGGDFWSNLSGMDPTHTAGYDLQRGGWQNYQPTAAPDLSSYFAGINANASQGLAQVNDNVQGATIDPTQQAQFRAAQTGLLGQLQAQANGTGPSLAQSQLKQATDRNLAQQLAAAASMRNGNQAPGAAQYQLGQNAAMTNQMAGAQSADIRAQEQLAAQQQIGALAGQGRGQDLGLATNQAQMNQQAALANQAAFNQQLGQDVGQRQQALMFSAGQQGQLGNLNEQQWQFLNQLNSGNVGQYNQNIGALTGQQQGAYQKFWPNVISNVGSGITTAATA